MATDELPQRTDPSGRGARGRILQAARVLFRSPGINATGVAELAAAAQVSKRTLYQHFASKDVVVVAYLRDLEQADAGREAVLGRSDLSARARLLELFGESDGEPAPLRGDAFVNAAVELSNPEHPAHRLAVAHKRAFAERLAAIAREAGARNPERVGRRLALLYDGAAAHAAVYGTADGFAEARLLAAAVLQQTID